MILSVDVPARLVASGSLPFVADLLWSSNGRHRTPTGELSAMRMAATRWPSFRRCGKSVE
jgi:hypothetical protein